MNKFKIVAKTLAGLEEILAKEIEQLGGSNIAIGNRMVSFVGDKQLLYKTNLWVRTALRIIKPIEQFDACDPDELYAQIKAIDWSKYVAEGQTILSKIDEIRTLRGELPLEVQDLEDEVIGLTTRIENYNADIVSCNKTIKVWHHKVK